MTIEPDQLDRDQIETDLYWTSNSVLIPVLVPYKTGSIGTEFNGTEPVQLSGLAITERGSLKFFINDLVCRL